MIYIFSFNVFISCYINNILDRRYYSQTLGFGSTLSDSYIARQFQRFGFMEVKFTANKLVRSFDEKRDLADKDHFIITKSY